MSSGTTIAPAAIRFSISAQSPQGLVARGSFRGDLERETARGTESVVLDRLDQDGDIHRGLKFEEPLPGTIQLSTPSRTIVPGEREARE